MAYQTADDIVKLWTSGDEAKEKAREIKSIQKDLDTAADVIRDGIERYRKKKLKARSKAAANSENPFAELDGYESKQQIQDDYGWDIITEARMDKLMELWDLREESKKQSADSGYHDRVTELLEQALRGMGEDLWEQIFDYKEEQKKLRQEAEAVARENNERTWHREHGKS